MWRVRVKLGSPVVAPTLAAAWQADTVFGHMCWAVVRAYGERSLTSMLEQYESGSPPLILSNGYPSGVLPRPLWTGGEERQADKWQALEAMSRAKQRRDRRLIAVADFERLRRGERVDSFTETTEVVNGRLRSHTTVSRARFTAEEGTLYAQPESWAPEVTVYARGDELGEIALDALRDYLEHEGYGKRRSAGFGATRQVTVEPAEDFGDVEGANGFITLSNFVPAPGDPQLGRWRLLAKRGKLGEDLAQSANPFKRRITFLEAGSCFRTDTPREWYGRMVKEVAVRRPEIVQYGLAYAVPIRLPEQS